MELRDVEIETQLLKLEDRPRGQPVAAGLLARIGLLFHERHRVAGAGQPKSSSRTCRSPADDYYIRRRHQRREPNGRREAS
jgi:hypothetical protein